MNMAKDKKGFGQRLQDFLSSYRGKVVMNYAYSWGAAVVIAGTLFKLTHLPGANLMLWLGMGTEVLVFFLSAFDLPRKETDTPVPVGGGGGASGVVVIGGGSSTPPMNEEMEAATQSYIARLNELTEMLGRITAGAEALGRDSEQMQHLNQNLTGINALYEMQLRSAGAQMNTIDRVHEETRKMARQIEELNAVYARMLQAMQARGNE